PTLLGVFDSPDDVAEVVTRLRARELGELQTFSPAPFEQIDEAMDENPSKVRIFTLVGGIIGVFIAYLMQIWMSYDWPIVFSGKPYASIPAYTIIGFELMVLFAGVLTLIGLLVVGGLPKFSTLKGYSARFSAEEFGVTVDCSDRDASEVEAVLRANSAKEVSVVDA
ncbi:MAG: DUF3341 domain-containing protein, partial [Deltaproteobacteria bacterium]|nr:DUF3341 domain-containing protein [Deltaproteobacteria bacterium]